jgi:hypothetical protein
MKIVPPNSRHSCCTPHNALAAIRAKIAPEKLVETKVIFKRALIF